MTNFDKLLKIVNILDDRLSPMTYKKLNELGVTKQQRKGWSQAQANNYIKNHTKNSQENSLNKKTSKKFDSSIYRKERPKSISKNDKRIEKLGEGDGTLGIKGIPGSSAIIDHTLITKSGKTFPKEIQERYDKIRSFEKEITDSMLDISDELNLPMHGLELDFKTGTSTAEKILTRKAANKKKNPNDNTSELEILNNFGDLIRYSYLSDSNNLVAHTNQVVKLLEEKGYKIAEIDNKYLNDKDGYKAIHLSFISPQGILGEIQMQTKEQLELKNKSHDYYKLSHSTSFSNEEREKYEQMSNDIWKSVTLPKNIKKLKSFKLSKDEINKIREKQNEK